MLLSLALIFVLALFLSKIFELIKLPTLLGMIATGIILGPYALNLIDSSILEISPELRKMALIIILIRAGFNLEIDDVKKNGRAGALLSFLPACFEITAIVIFAPLFFGVSYLEAAIMGAVLAAVSPAVIVPRMINLIDKKIGTEKKIPQLIMAGASLDDIFVMVLFSVFVGMQVSGQLEGLSLLKIPTSIIIGIVVGFATAILLKIFFTKIHIRDSAKILIIMSIAFAFVTIEDTLDGIIGFSGLLAVMATAIMLRQKKPELTKRLSNKFSKMWVVAEILLFTLVGAGVDISYAINAGLMAIVLIFVALAIRIIGVYTSLLGTKLNGKEKLFCAFSYMPKATVQAAIGGIPLSMGLACGDLVLTMAVLSIIVTAPLGAFLIDKTQNKLL
ncbi:MAG: cation:proton antiporter [Clostridia bacterium]